MNKKIFIKNKPFDTNDSIQMQQWIEDNIINVTKTLMSNGISSGLDVTLNSNMTLNINPGIGYDSSYNLINSTTQRQVTLSNGDTSPRYDLITLKFKTTTTNNVDTNNNYGQGTSYIYSQNEIDDFDIIIHKGTPGTTPIKPTIPSDELGLAYINVPANATVLTSGSIEDARIFIDLEKDFTVNDTQIPNTNIGTIANLVSWLANRIKKITGNSDWKTDPTLNLLNVEPKFTKNTAFNKNFGSAAGTVTEGNDTRLSDSRTPKAHASTHKTGGSDPLVPSDIGAEPSISKNSAFNKNFGTTAGTVTEGSDSRLSDARTPKAHKSTHATGGSDALAPGDIGAEPAITKNSAFNKNFGGTGTATTVSHSDHNHDGTYVKPIITLGDGVDLNTVITSGFYRLGNIPVNVPSGSIVSYGQLIVSRGSDTLFQIVTGYNDSRFYMRQASGIGVAGTAWQPWVEMENTAGSQNKANAARDAAENWAKGYGLGDYAKLLTNGTDLNTIKTTGFYRVNAGVNAPPRVPSDNVGIWHYIIVLGHDTSWTSQIAIEYNTGIMFTRASNNGAWTSWAQQETTTGAQNKADNTRKDSTKEFHVEVRTSDPVSPAVGRIWLRSDL